MAVAAELPWTLGDKLAKARRNAGMEQSAVASALGVSRALVSKWERDASEPTLSQARHWAEVTGVSFEWLSASGYNHDYALHPLDEEQGELWDRRLATPYNAHANLAAV